MGNLTAKGAKGIRKAHKELMEDNSKESFALDAKTIGGSRARASHEALFALSIFSSYSQTMLCALCEILCVLCGKHFILLSSEPTTNNPHQ